MKKLIWLAIVLLMSLSTSSFAQKTLKIGHINMDSVAQLMPEVDSMRVKIEKKKAVQARTMKIEEENFTILYESYMKNAEGMPEAWIQAKQEELYGKQQAIETLKRVDFPGQLQEIQEEYLQMMYDKIMETVKAIAQDMHYTYIFNSGEGLSGVLYAAPYEDITNMVIKKLDLDPNKKIKTVE